MNTYYDRATRNKSVGSFTDQPTLWEMTEKALEILSKNDHGFFLMVEGGLIDKQLHPHDWERAAYDTIEFDKAIEVAKRFAERRGDTLIIVTADHSHSNSITGTYWEGDGRSGREAVRLYAEAGFPTYTHGQSGRFPIEFPDTPEVERKLAVHFGNHPDFYNDYHFPEEPTSPTIRTSDGKTVANPNRLKNPDDPNKGRFFNPGTIASDLGVHTADDVTLMAYGPGAQYFKGTMNNTDVFIAMARAGGFDLLGRAGSPKTPSVGGAR